MTVWVWRLCGRGGGAGKNRCCLQQGGVGAITMCSTSVQPPVFLGLAQCESCPTPPVRQGHS